MSDVIDMIRAGIKQEDSRAEQIRIKHPDGTDAIDQLRAAFGPGVKAKWLSDEGQGESGKRIPFDGTDINQIIRLDDMTKKRAGK